MPKGIIQMRKPSYLLRFALLLALTVAALVPAARLAAQTQPGSGLEQTPIDIRDGDLTFDPNLPALGFSYGTKVALNVINKNAPDEFGTVRAELSADDQSQLVVDGVHYKLRQFHFHTPSEHERNGRKFPVEMHLVHRLASDPDHGPIAVVGVFVVEGKENKELKKMFADLPQQPEETRPVKHFNLTRLLPESLESFRYRGSLTTPNFDENVSWVVLAEPIEMSGEQIEAFRALFPEGNSREIQPLNGRTIKTDVAPVSE